MHPPGLIRTAGMKEMDELLKHYVNTFKIHFMSLTTINPPRFPTTGLVVRIRVILAS